MIFKKPIDPDEGLTEEERAKKLEDFRKNDFDKNDERAMILAALKTFLPPVLLILGLFALVGFLLVALFNGF